MSTVAYAQAYDLLSLSDRRHIDYRQTYSHRRFYKSLKNLGFLFSFVKTAAKLLTYDSYQGIREFSNGEQGCCLPKHFVGNSGTVDGINENNTIISREGPMNIHMPAYKNAMYKGVSTVVISYSSWNGVKMHANQDLVTGYLKNTLKFQGFVISYWEGTDRITTPVGS